MTTERMEKIMYYDADTLEELSDWELDERYQSMLDDCYPEVEVAGVTFYPSSVLEECDPVAYRTGYNDWLDSEVQDGAILDEDAYAELQDDA